jgi:hypothetical protein
LTGLDARFWQPRSSGIGGESLATAAVYHNG